MMPMFMFSGFFANAGSYSDWIGWLQWISPVKYCLEAYIYNEFDDREYGPNDTNLIDFLNFEIGIWGCVGILLGLGIFLRLLSAFFLQKLVSKFQ